MTVHPRYANQEKPKLIAHHFLLISVALMCNSRLLKVLLGSERSLYEPRSCSNKSFSRARCRAEWGMGGSGAAGVEKLPASIIPYPEPDLLHAFSKRGVVSSEYQ